MDQQALKKVTRKVARQFPELKDARPAIKRQVAAGNGKEQYVLTFKGKAELPGGRSIKRIVRVIADSSGNVIRMSTSK
jgi:hypothetical protein